MVEILTALPPDGERRGRPAWRLRTVLMALAGGLAAVALEEAVAEEEEHGSA